MERRYDSWEEELLFQKEVQKEVKRQRRQAINRMILLALVFSILGAVVGGAIVDKVTKDSLARSPFGTTNPQDITINADDDVNVGAAVAAKNLNAVVGISSTTTMSDIFNRTYESMAIGSGFIVDKEGYILTNDHVIAALSQGMGGHQRSGVADDIRVVFNNGEQVPAEVLWSDPALDLAILKIEPDKQLPVVELGDSDDIVIGEKVFAIGNPLALEFHGTFTGGYISGLDRTLSGNGFRMSNLIQTDAAINSGNSGGPLFDVEGKVIGINTAKVKSGEGLGFSIAINTVKPILEEVVKNQSFERVSMGFYPEELYILENYLQKEFDFEGVVVREVIPDTPAERAGLQSLDILTKIDGKTIKSVDELMKTLYTYRFDDTVTLELYRDGRFIETELTFTH